jgi:Kef-type K+ transport system membrane component KefB
MSLASAALVSLLAFVVPLIVRLIRLPVPDIVVQILFGIILGPQVLGWARIDEQVRVLSADRGDTLRDLGRHRHPDPQ